MILRALATGGSKGYALSELTALLQLPHPSVHRVLQQLLSERMVTRDLESKRYKLGPLTFELGLVGSLMHDIRDLCEGPMVSLANEFGDTVYLVVRSGFDAVCIHRKEGAYPIRTLVLDVGSRRPLGIGAGGLAILSAIDQSERMEIISRISDSIRLTNKLSPTQLEAVCQESQKRGVSIIENRVTLGVRAVGAPFRNSLNQPVGALSVAALCQRLNTTRINQISRALKSACAEVEVLMRRHHR